MKIANCVSVYLLLIISIVCSSNSQRETPLADSDCKENSFQVYIKDLRINQLEANIFYNISLTNDATIPSGSDFRAYVDKCLENVLVSYRVEGELQSIIKKVKIPSDLSLNGLYIQIPGLRPLTHYNLQFGIEQTKPKNVSLFHNVTHNLHSCFGEPSKPKNVLKHQRSDGSVLISWSEPDIIAAPYLGYYEILKTVSNNAQTKEEYQLNSYTLSRDEISKNVLFKLTAYNDQKMYSTNYPFVVNCSDKILSSGVEIIKLNATFLPNTTPKPGNSALTLKLNSFYPILFSVILYFII